MPDPLAALTHPRRSQAMLVLVALVATCCAVTLSPASALATAPTTLYVSASARSNPACSAASVSNPFATIAAALACAVGGDTIKVGAGTFKGGFTIPVNIVLDGAGANLTKISDASNINPPEVTVAPAVTTVIENLTVSGKAGTNAGILAGSGSLTLSRVTVDRTFDVSPSDPAAVAVIPSSGTASLTVLDSTVSNGFDQSGGIYVQGFNTVMPSTASIINSTISGNAADNDAGGVFVTFSDLTLRDDTIAHNTGANGAGGLELRSSTATVTDSLIATNTSQGSLADCAQQASSQVADGGHNLIGVANPGTSADCGFVNGTYGDLTGTAATPLNPDLGPLAANGGPTQTQALQPGSPAILSGNPSDCEAVPVNDLDQRGDSRAAITRQVCDIGAYDTGGKGGTTLHVSSAAHTNPACSAASASNPFATIAAALACAVSGDTIKVGAGTFAGGFMIPVNIVFTGTAANLTKISDASNISSPEVRVAPVVSTVIENLAVSGKAGSNEGILAGSGSLTLSKVTVDRTIDVTPADPASVAVIPSSGSTASLNVLDSTVSNGTGGDAGGIDVQGFNTLKLSTASIVNSTISGNHADQNAGGLYVTNANLTIRDDTIAHNVGAAGAGGLEFGSATATVTDSLIATNTSQGSLADCAQQASSQVTDGGHNLIGVANPGTSDDCGFVNGTNGDLTGTAASPLNPDLGPLAANGGPTQTQALQPGSPAIAAGNPSDCEAAPVNDLDQRGKTRAATTRNTCDIGAYDTRGVS